jgi:two-component system nitrogen regulation response regulator GlnG
MKKELYPAHPVLLVDDEEQFLASAGFILKGAGIGNIVTCSDSLRVMSLLRERRFSVVLLDLSIPHLSGSELLGEIRKDFPGLPVIIVTALNDTEIAAQCLEKGALDYLVKPLHARVFIDAVNEAIKTPNS